MVVNCLLDYGFSAAPVRFRILILDMHGLIVTGNQGHSVQLRSSSKKVSHRRWIKGKCKEKVNNKEKG